jgi:hypothetical protein
MRKILFIVITVVLFPVLRNIWFAQNTMWWWIVDGSDMDGWNNIATPNADDWNMESQNQESPASSWDEGVCPWDDKNYIILNTNVPFVWRCIEKKFSVWDDKTNVSNVFPRLMAYMIRIMMTVLVVWWFLGILVWWFMIASNGAFGSKQTGVKLILGVIAGLILLWASGIILNLINPNFFGTAS